MAVIGIIVAVLVVMAATVIVITTAVKSVTTLQLSTHNVLHTSVTSRAVSSFSAPSRACASTCGSAVHADEADVGSDASVKLRTRTKDI
jgi:hypothetical protein